jgi:hypothetical protein
MVSLCLSRSGGEEVHRAGPFPWVRVLAESLRAGPEDKEIGRYRGGVWHTNDDCGTRLSLHGSSCSIRFEDGTGETDNHGPFDEVEFVDGAVYTFPGRLLLARLDEQKKQWYAYDAGRWWPGLVVERWKASGGGS